MYAEADEAYKDFLTRHPTNKEVPHALYMLGLSNFKQKMAIDRDQAYTREALKYFQRVIKQYPDSENHDDALEKARECRNDLAKRERYVAKFYFRERAYYAALGRYLEIIDEYADTKYNEEALYMAGRCYIKLKEPDRAKVVLNTLIAEYPESKYANRARSLVDKLDSP